MSVTLLSWHVPGPYSVAFSTRGGGVSDDFPLAQMYAHARTLHLVDGPDEDVHSFVERLLVERLGDPGRRLHTGRSRNEQVSLDLRLYLRRRIPILQHGVARLGPADL